jgi:hypothetical protein
MVWSASSCRPARACTGRPGGVRDRRDFERRRRARLHALADAARGGEHLEGTGEIQCLDAFVGQDQHAQGGHATEPARSSACCTLQIVAKRPASTAAVRDLMSAASSGLAVGLHHVEGQRGVGHVVDLPAQVRGVAGGGFAALLGANAAHDQPADAVLGEPDIEPAVDQRAVAVLGEGGGSMERREPVDGMDMARFDGEWIARIAGLVDMEDAHDRQAGRRAPSISAFWAAK